MNGLTEWRQDAAPVKLESTVWAARQLLLTTQMKWIKNCNYPKIPNWLHVPWYREKYQRENL